MSNFFIFQSPLIVEETHPDYVMVEATLLTEGVSTKGFYYTPDDTDFNLVAETSNEKPIYYGVNQFNEHKAPRVVATWLHEKSGLFYDNVKPIGKIVKSWFDEKLRRVKAKLKIWDKNVMGKIKEGFKVSIRGLFDKFKDVVLDGKIVRKIIGMKIHDVQLVPPEAKTGVKGAVVERVLEETMSFFELEEDEDVAVVSQLIREGYIV